MFPWKTTNPVAVKPRKAVEPVKSCKHTKHTCIQSERRGTKLYRWTNSGEANGPSIITMVIAPTQNPFLVSIFKPPEQFSVTGIKNKAQTQTNTRTGELGLIR